MGAPIPPYYRQLLVTAERFRSEGQHDVAVIVAQTACELVTESAFEAFFRVHGSTESDKKNLRPRAYDLGNERVRGLYVLLSWDRIEHEQFWSDFKDHVKLRHGIVHKGQRATPQQAEASVRAATNLIAHVEAVIAGVSAS